LLKRLSFLIYLGSFVKNPVDVPVWVYIWVLYSVSLVFMSAFVPVPCCFYCYVKPFLVSFLGTLFSTHLPWKDWVEILFESLLSWSSSGKTASSKQLFLYVQWMVWIVKLPLLPSSSWLLACSRWAWSGWASVCCMHAVTQGLHLISSSFPPLL
jgi:hypothetical protein